MATFYALDGAGTNVQTFSGDRIYVCSATPASSGTVTAGSGRVRITSAGSTKAKVIIYSDSGGEPNAPLAVSDEVTVDWTSSTDTSFPFSGANQISVTGGTAYWIGFMFDDPGTPSFEMKRNNTSNVVRYKGITYPTAPNPLSADGSSNGPLNVVITYTEAASSSVKTFCGLANASIKTINGLTRASVKTVNGLA